MYNIR